MRIRAVKLKPGAAGAFIDDASAVTDRVVPVDAVLAGAPAVADVFADGGGDDVDGFDVILRFLRRRRRRDRATDTALAVGACAVIAASGVTRVDELVAVTGLAPRELQRLFRQQVGLAPKVVIQRQRLQEVAVRLDAGALQGAAPRLTDLALELGYVDVAHLSRGFAAFTGRSPRALAQALR